MEKLQKKGLQRIAVVGAVIIVILLAIGTVWLGRAATSDTQTAVRTVNLIYLDELAGRREQVVASTLANYIDNLDVAIGLLGISDLADTEHLQAYQARMKQLYGLERFAFVDSNGLIYTSRGTRTDIDQYNFDYNNLYEPHISIKNVDSNNKKIIVAVPVDHLPFEGKSLVACFMEIDMNRMLGNISLQVGTNNNITFCNLYANTGESLTNVVLGGLTGEKNLLTALALANFEDGHSLNAMRDDFANKRGGVVSFTYNDIRETMCYVPVRSTDWMLTYLVRESVLRLRRNCVPQFGAVVADGACVGGSVCLHAHANAKSRQNDP